MIEAICNLCLRKKEVKSAEYKRVGLVVKLCKECEDDIRYLSKIKKRSEGWVYNQLFNKKKDLKNPKEIYEMNHINQPNGPNDNERPVEEE